MRWNKIARLFLNLVWNCAMTYSLVAIWFKWNGAILTKSSLPSSPKNVTIFHGEPFLCQSLEKGCFGTLNLDFDQKDNWFFNLNLS